MKKTMMLIGVAGLLSLASCKKDWVCKCTDQSGNSENHEITDETLLDARSKCKAMNYDNTVLGVHTSNTCSLQ